MVKERGVYSIETVWFERERHDGVVESDVTSVEPVLNAIRRHYDTPVVCRDVATKDELKFYVQKWCGYPMSYPVLHIGIHGSSGMLHLYDGSEVTLEEISDWMTVSCRNCIVHSSSCSVLKGADLTPLLEDCGFSAVSGYRKTMYPMINAWAFEMIYLSLLHKTRHKYLEPNAMRSVDKKLSDAPYGELKKGIGFRISIAP